MYYFYIGIAVGLFAVTLNVFFVATVVALDIRSLKNTHYFCYGRLGEILFFPLLLISLVIFTGSLLAWPLWLIVLPAGVYCAVLSMFRDKVRSYFTKEQE